MSKCCGEVWWRSVLGMCWEPSVNILTRFGNQRSRCSNLAPTTSYSGFTPLILAFHCHETGCARGGCNISFMCPCHYRICQNDVLQVGAREVSSGMSQMPTSARLFDYGLSISKQPVNIRVRGFHLVRKMWYNHIHYTHRYCPCSFNSEGTMRPFQSLS